MRSSHALGLNLLVLAATLACGTEIFAQAPVAPLLENTAPSQRVDRPLPDISALLQDVGVHQKAAEFISKDYLYHSVDKIEEQDGKGNAKKTTTDEFDHFWVAGVPVSKMTRKNGRDLTADEQKKENERIDKEVAKAQEKKDKADAKSKETSPRGDDLITASRFLQLGSFTNPRRIQLDGRDTIVVEFAGNPSAKTRNRGEDIVRDLAGTVWLDEQDRAIRRIEVHFFNRFRIGGGLVANIRKDTSFSLDQTKVNGEVWLPKRIQREGAARALHFFNFNGSIVVQMSDYRKFKTTSTILPDVNKVEETPASPPPQ